jgi:bacterioferritin-associated ferredoxin
MIVCLCRGKNERAVQAAIDAGAGSVRDLMACGIGDQCGSCHNVLRGMLARAAAAQPCPTCAQPQLAAASAMASAGA